MAGVDDLDRAQAFTGMLERRHAVPPDEVGELGQRRHQRQRLVVLHVHAGAGDDEAVPGGEQAVEQLAADLEAAIAVAEQVLAFGEVVAVALPRGDGLVVVAGEADHPKRHAPQRDQRRGRDHAGSQRLPAHRRRERGGEDRFDIVPGHGHVRGRVSPGGRRRLPQPVELLERHGQFVALGAGQLPEGLLEPVAPLAHRPLWRPLVSEACSHLAVEVVDDAEDRDERGERLDVGRRDRRERDDATEGRLGGTVGHDRSEQGALEAQPPGVGRERWLIETGAAATGGVEAPADLRPLDAPLPDLEGLVVEAEVGEHEGVGGHGQHRIDRRARVDEFDQGGEQFRTAAHVANATVGHEQRQMKLRRRTVPNVTRHVAVEHRLEVRSELRDLRTQDHDLVGREIGNLPEGVEDRVVQHLRLPAEVVAAMDAHRLVIGRERCGSGGSGGRLARGHRVPEPDEQRRVRGRRGIGRGVGVPWKQPLRREQPLRLTRASQPGIDERIDVGRRFRIAAPRGRGLVVGDRRGAARPRLAERGRGMHEEHLDLARPLGRRRYFGQPREQMDLMEREPLKPRHEHGLGRALAGLLFPRRRALLADPFPHLSPEVELPAVMPRQGFFRTVPLVIRLGAELGTPLFPLEDHARPAEVVMVEAVGDPSGGEQRAARPLDDIVEGRIAREHRQDRERETVDVPRIRVRAHLLRDQRRDRARV